jgi:hypothetical protein
MTCYKRNVKRFSSSSEAIDFVFSKYEKPPLSKEQFTERIWLKFPDEIKRDQIRDICTMLNKNISKRVPECAKQILSNDDLSNLFLEFLALKRGKSKDFYKY